MNINLIGADLYLQHQKGSEASHLISDINANFAIASYQMNLFLFFCSPVFCLDGSPVESKEPQNEEISWYICFSAIDLGKEQIVYLQAAI